MKKLLITLALVTPAHADSLEDAIERCFDMADFAGTVAAMRNVGLPREQAIDLAEAKGMSKPQDFVDGVYELSFVPNLEYAENAFFKDCVRGVLQAHRAARQEDEGAGNN